MADVRRAGAPLATLATGVACAAVQGVGLGSTGVLSALCAVLVVAAFFWSSPLPMLLLRGAGDAAALGLLLLLMNYAVRVGAGLLVLAAAVAAGLADREAVGIDVVLCALVWVNTQVVLLGRVRDT